MVKIRIGQVEATIEAREWTSGSRLWQRILEDETRLVATTGADPWPDETIAQHMVRVYKAVIVDSEPPEHDQNAIY